MGVGEDHHIHLLGQEAKLAVQCIRIFSHSLEHAAIEQDLFSILKGEQVLGTRYGTCCAVKSDFHYCLCLMSLSIQNSKALGCWILKGILISLFLSFGF